MSQWRTDEHGNRRHKRQWRCRANLVYFYKWIVNVQLTELIPFGAETIDVYTSKPKRKGAFAVWFRPNRKGRGR